jgi:DtxR family Mn-dependent transcriptional regulator
MLAIFRLGNRDVVQLTFTEENYLKAIYALQQQGVHGDVGVNEISERMATKPATVTDMLRKLSEKQLINYEKYKRITLAPQGVASALQIVRKHRLWETFLHDKLRFSWDEVHEVAEQLEHIQSQKLTDRLDDMLGHPRYDPHGDPIPNAQGEMPPKASLGLMDAQPGNFRLISMRDSSAVFLQQLQRLELHPGHMFKLLERMPYDNSLLILLEHNGKEIMLSERTASNLLVAAI